MAVTAPTRAPWAGLFRPLERDERVFAVLLAFVMVGGLATLGLVPLRPRHRVDVYSLVFWFASTRRASSRWSPSTRARPARIFIGALCIDLLLVFAPPLPHRAAATARSSTCFFPLVAVNAYYFGRWVGLFLTLVAGLLYWAGGQRWRRPGAAWTAVVILMALVGLPAFALGHVADRERRARGEVERLNAELTGHAHPAAGRPGRSWSWPSAWPRSAGCRSRSRTRCATPSRPSS